MRSTLTLTGLVLLAASGTALASGYRIPEQSVNSTARAGGYVAHTPGADASYFNPANMAWLDPKAQIEAKKKGLTCRRSALADGSVKLTIGGL